VTDVKVKTTLSVLVAIVAISGVIWTLASMQTQVGVPKAIGVGKPAQDPAFLTVDPVSGTPTEWVSAVCRERVHQLPSDMGNPLRGIGFLYPNTEFELPGSTYSATCKARTTPVSDQVLLLAEYPDEDSMQLDLADNGVKWYCFAGHRGRLLVIATRAAESYAGSNGLATSPVLEPLTSYEFSVYGDPGP
jgi:hypothetical protein